MIFSFKRDSTSVKSNSKENLFNPTSGWLAARPDCSPGTLVTPLGLP